MALTAEQLYQASQLEPADLGEDVVSPELDNEEAKAAMLAWITANVLPGANAEVSVPFRRASGYGTVAEFIAARFPEKTENEQAALTTEGVTLWDFAVRSYGRSEINKSINSSSETYDRDSDQDRIQGNQRLEKLLEWVAVLKDESDSDGVTESVLPRSSLARVSVSWT